MAKTTGEDGGEITREEDKAILQFLDSLDGYITSMSSLSSVLRQGWLELGSARHSMGSSRISSTLFDLKAHSASTTVDVHESSGESHSASPPHFILSKWGTQASQKYSLEEGDINEKSQKETSLGLRHRNSPGLKEAHQATDDSTSDVDIQIQKKRLKSLSMFGTLISPKLREAQVSFETALESLIEMANRRSMVLSTFNRLQQVDDSN
ncbi:hypothetical protein Taro_029174 [Colocasia esculenta]|uniref:Vacuolar ATPase assembly protein VMA22 n=1 Tax=Colocasia esculenta TaxID=4460 RepID=A0A843VIB4_COLES|nr:hypothetical protein [Colocasia esculenta]